MKAIVVGDIHGRFDLLKELLGSWPAEFIDVIISVGDFGYFPNLNSKHLLGHEHMLENNAFGKTKIYFCDGNHEDHWSLKNLKDTEVYENVFYMRRGSILQMEDLKIMFFGGAESIDRGRRVLGRDWFPEESITQAELDYALNTPEHDRPNVIISHTCPTKFNIPQLDMTPIPGIGDSSRRALDVLLDVLQPMYWLFGHWHVHYNGSNYGTRRSTAWWAMSNLEYENSVSGKYLFLKNNFN